MASGAQEQGALSAASDSDKTKDTLSQFATRVLDQLSLSAWLPSAALILAVAFIFQLGATLDTPGRTRNPPDVLGTALTAMADVSLGGAALFVVGVVVITMITQAFEFEAIRTLEGYWGTNALVEWIANLRCAHFRRKKKKLEQLRGACLDQAWKGARDEFERREREFEAHGEPRQLTADMIEKMGAQVMGRESRTKLTEDERNFLRSIKWKDSAPPEPMRRLVNIDKRLRYMPGSQRLMPTRLGNTLRSCEDRVGRTPIESFIQEVFDELPLSLRIEHDKERGRLDLYCSMVFVLLFVAAIGVGRLAWGHAYWCAAALALLAGGIWLMYRAAITSAQAYGALLETVGALVDNRAHEPPTGVD